MNFHQSILPLFNQSRSEWLKQARQAALTIHKETVTADDIHKHCPLPDNIDPRVMGAVFTRKHWRKVGYTQSTRKTCHHRPIALFQRT